jgi:hypothetical protein
MKKFFLIAAAAAMVLSSCSKNEVSENNSESNLIGFSTYTGRATKADGSFVPKGTAAIPTGSRFGVYCYHTGATAFASATNPTPNFMSNQWVQYNGNANGNTEITNYNYSPTRYWPTDEASNKLSFIAYYPYEENVSTTDGLTAIPTSSTTGLGTYTFKVPTDPSKQIDFMMSNLMADETYTSTGGNVPLEFHHMLTQVNFKAKTDADATTTVTLTSVKLIGVLNSGTLTVTSTATGNTWTLGTTTDTYEVPISATHNTLSSTAIDFTTNADDATKYPATLLLMPQTIPAAATVEIKYTYKTTGMTTTITDTKTVVLNTKLATWSKNNNILYTFNVGLHKITFTATVSGWDDQNQVDL